MKAISNLLSNEAWRSVILVVSGFLLAQLKDFFAQRKERREAVSVLLSDPLEVRHQFIGVELLIDELGTLGPLPEHVNSQIRVVLDSLFPNWKELHDRYDESVTAVARIDPLLAFQLRSKDFVRPVMRTLHSLMGQDSQAAALFAPAVKANLVSKVEKALNESILKLARRQSLWCWFKTRRGLRDTNKFPEDAREVWESMKSLLRRWSMEHRTQLKRWKDDQKYEQRQIPAFAERRERATEKYRKRIDSACHELAAQLANYAARRHFAVVHYDDSEHGFYNEFPWAKLRILLDQKWNAYGIESQVAKPPRSPRV